MADQDPENHLWIGNAIGLAKKILTNRLYKMTLIANRIVLNLLQMINLKVKISDIFIVDCRFNSFINAFKIDT